MAEEDNKPIHSDISEYAESTQSMQIKKVDSRHRAMMRLLISGYKNAELEEIFGLGPARISVIINSPLFREELKKMEAEVGGEYVKNEGSKAQLDFVRIRLKEEAQRSLDKLVQLRDGAQSERVQQLSAVEILDRAGVVRTDKVEGELIVDASEGLVNALAEAVKVMRESKDGTKIAEETKKEDGISK